MIIEFENRNVTDGWKLLNFVSNYETQDVYVKGGIILLGKYMRLNGL